MSLEDALWRACKDGDDETALRIARRKALRVNHRQTDPRYVGQTALHAAAECGRLQVVEALIARRATVHLRAGDGRTPLANACDGGHLDVALCLLKNGAQAHSKDRKAWTPLMHAAESGNEKLVRHLIVAGARSQCRNLLGQSALDIARLFGHEEIADFLRDFCRRAPPRNPRGSSRGLRSNARLERRRPATASGLRTRRAASPGPGGSPATAGTSLLSTDRPTARPASAAPKSKPWSHLVGQAPASLLRGSQAGESASTGTLPSSPLVTSTASPSFGTGVQQLPDRSPHLRHGSNTGAPGGGSTRRPFSAVNRARGQRSATSSPQTAVIAAQRRRRPKSAIPSRRRAPARLEEGHESPTTYSVPNYSHEEIILISPSLRPDEDAPQPKVSSSGHNPTPKSMREDATPTLHASSSPPPASHNGREYPSRAEDQAPAHVDRGTARRPATAGRLRPKHSLLSKPVPNSSDGAPDTTIRLHSPSQEEATPPAHSHDPSPSLLNLRLARALSASPGGRRSSRTQLRREGRASTTPVLPSPLSRPNRFHRNGGSSLGGRMVPSTSSVSPSSEGGGDGASDDEILYTASSTGRRSSSPASDFSATGRVSSRSSSRSSHTHGGVALDGAFGASISSRKTRVGVWRPSTAPRARPQHAPRPGECRPGTAPLRRGVSPAREAAFHRSGSIVSSHRDIEPEPGSIEYFVRRSQGWLPAHKTRKFRGSRFLPNHDTSDDGEIRLDSQGRIVAGGSTILPGGAVRSVSSKKGTRRSDVRFGIGFFSEEAKQRGRQVGRSASESVDHSGSESTFEVPLRTSPGPSMGSTFSAQDSLLSSSLDMDPAASQLTASSSELFPRSPVLLTGQRQLFFASPKAVHESAGAVRTTGLLKPERSGDKGQPLIHGSSATGSQRTDGTASTMAPFQEKPPSGTLADPKANAQTNLTHDASAKRSSREGSVSNTPTRRRLDTIASAGSLEDNSLFSPSGSLSLAGSLSGVLMSGSPSKGRVHFKDGGALDAGATHSRLGATSTPTSRHPGSLCRSGSGSLPHSLLLDTLWTPEHRDQLKQPRTILSPNERLAAAVTCGKLSDTRSALRNGANPSVRIPGSDGFTPLLLAAESGNADSMALLIQSGAQLDAVDKSGDSALHHAVRWGHGSCIRLLIDSKAPVDLRNCHDETPLILAARQGLRPVVAALLAAGANPEHTTKEGETAYSAAVAGEHKSIADLLQTVLSTG